jgi:hypothetical protein
MNPRINPVIHPGMAMALSLFLLTPAQARSVEDPAMATPACCHEIMGQKQKMNEAFKAQDADLNERIAKMNSAPEDRKVELMASIITVMAEQRTTRDERRTQMEKRIMTHVRCPMNMHEERAVNHCTSSGWVGMHDAPWDKK